MVSNMSIDLTVIIVNWNTRELLKNCLESIICYNKRQVKIIVVDNASSDGSRDMVETMFPEVKIINSGGNIGFGRANNLAVPYADTPLVLFLNPDTLVMERTLEEMTDFMKSHPSVGAMSCMITYGPGQTETVGTDGEAHTLGLQWFPSPITELLQMLFLSDKMIYRLKKWLPYKNPHLSGYVAKLYGTCLMVRKDVLEKVGCFDERFFMYGEDVDLSRRITDAGWKLYYMSDVKIAHFAGGASSSTNNQFSALMMCESISKLMEKYYGKSGKFLYRWAMFLGGSLRILMLVIIRTGSKYKFLKNLKKKSAHFDKYLSIIKWSMNLEKAEIRE
jgi:hypothetical protein